jgi:DNA-binding NarL/FixJ family response regulator
MIEKINQTFEGDLNDKTPSHKNSLCRIVYVFYLRNQGLKTREIAKKMNCCKSSVNTKLRKHQGFYQFDKNYRKKIDELFGG